MARRIIDGADSRELGSCHSILYLGFAARKRNIAARFAASFRVDAPTQIEQLLDHRYGHLFAGITFPGNGHIRNTAAVEFGLGQSLKSRPFFGRSMDTQTIIFPRQIIVEQQVKIANLGEGIQFRAANAERHHLPSGGHQRVRIRKEQGPGFFAGFFCQIDMPAHDPHKIMRRQIIAISLAIGPAIFGNKGRVEMRRQLACQRRLTRALGTVKNDVQRNNANSLLRSCAI